MTRDLTQGRPAKVLLSFAIPIFFSTLFQQLYNITDSIIAGKFAGEQALAAIGASYPVTMIFMAIAVGSNSGCSVIISQLFGAGRTKDMKTAVSTSLISLFAISVILTVGALIFTPQIMTAMRTPSDIYNDANTYFRIYIGGFTFLSVYNISTGVFTALGDSKTPLWFLIGSSIINTILDYLFVAVYGWGVEGAAWATFIAQGAACLLLLWVLVIRMRSIESNRFDIFSFRMLGNLGRVSIQTILQSSFISVGNMLVQGLINSCGLSSVIAGYAASTKLNSFAITSVSTASNAMAAFTAQNVGARRFDRVKQGYHSCILIALLIASPFIIGYTFFSDFFVRLFLDNNSSALAVETGSTFLKMISPFYAVVTLKLMSDSVTRGAGAMKLFAISTFVDLILRVAISYALYPSLGVNGIALSWPIGWVIGAVLAILFYRFGNWRDHALT